MFSNLRLLALLAVAGLSVPALGAAECSARSKAHPVPLLELYTSEGCSSCPPADRWLSQLVPTARAGSVVPLALHVDYWDYIGWKDRFSQPQFSARQRQMSKLQRLPIVYTPQLLLNGRDFRNWSSPGALEAEIKSREALPAKAEIALTLQAGTPGELVIHARVNTGQPDAVFQVVVYENNLSTTVKAGENSGALLRHDFVARTWLGPFPVKSGESWRANIRLDPGWKPGDLGVAAFIQDVSSGEVLQALAMPLCTGVANGR